jgi:hypothetical protein
MSEIITTFSKYNPFAGIDLNNFIINFIFAAIILTIGIFLGKIISIGLKKLSHKFETTKTVRGSFVDLFIAVIRWSVYIIFLTMALNKLEIPTLTNVLTNALVAIPALTGALILIVIGFGIAYYLKKIIENSEITGWRIISQTFFFFILFVFGIFALETALIPLNEQVTTYIVVAITSIITAAIAYLLVKKELKRHE